MTDIASKESPAPDMTLTPTLIHQVLTLTLAVALTLAGWRLIRGMQTHRSMHSNPGDDSQSQSNLGESTHRRERPSFSDVSDYSECSILPSPMFLSILECSILPF